ncbi:MAG: hypothetical protein A2X29_10835 [Elusimicrobia bacterium GWA2_64_40]|nr:MAG: hypothetical protein A2X29_10835 [Elusimicrobia bacterium GWA2_64_40]HAN05937.1 hypothetical protein [Elusimicrobiota bacterium]
MKILLLILALLPAAATARAAEGDSLEWKARAHAAAFCYIEESGSYDADSWGELAPEARQAELERAGGPAMERFGRVKDYYARMTERWSLDSVAEKLGRLDDGGIRAVRIWMGGEHAAYLEGKRSALARLNGPGGELTKETLTGAARYLDAAAVTELNAALKAGSGLPERVVKQQQRQGEMAGRVSGVKGAYSESAAAGNGSRFFDNSSQKGGGVDGAPAGVAGGDRMDAGKVSANSRQSYARTVAGGAVPLVGGAAAPARTGGAIPAADLKRIDAVVADMKQKRQAAGSENGWLGNFKQSVGLTKADSGCSGWSEATIRAIKSDPALSEKYEVGYVRGLRNPVGAVTKWPPSVPVPLPHFVAVVWPKGTDPNDTGMYVDSWAKDTKRGPIREYTREYSFDPKDLTPTVYYDRQVKKEIKLANGKTRVVYETVETPVPLIKANPWIFVK